MSWVTVIWSMIASACLTLAAMHVLIWANKRTAWASLLFSLTAVATAAVAGCELWLMRAETAREFGAALRWAHVPYWVLIISLVGFVRLYLRAGRPWLAYAICGMRTLSLILNFVFSPNLNYREITGLRHVRFLGESVSVAEGISNPWMLVGQASFLLLAVFVVDVMRTVSRRGDRRQARVLTGAIVFFVLAATGQIVLVLWQIVHSPLTPSLFFLGIVAAMAYEMSADVRRAAQLSDDLRESEERMTLATEAGGVGMWMWSIARNQVWGSERWLHLFGFAPDVALSLEDVIQRIHPDDRGTVEREVRRAVEDRGDYAGEYRVVLPDGTQRWLAARGRTYSDAHGKPVRMVGAATDITARNQAETEAARQRNELAHLSRVATAERVVGLARARVESAAGHHSHQRPGGAAPPRATAARSRRGARHSRGHRERRPASGRSHPDDCAPCSSPGRRSLQPLSVNDIIEDVLRIARSDLIGRGVTVHLQPGRERAASSGRPHPAPASAAQSDPQCLRRDVRQSARAPAPDPGDDAPRWRGADFRFGHRLRSAAGRGTHVRAVLHHQETRPGPRVVHLPLHRHGAQGPVVGGSAWSGRRPRCRYDGKPRRDLSPGTAGGGRRDNHERHPWQRFSCWMTSRGC